MERKFDSRVFFAAFIHLPCNVSSLALVVDGVVDLCLYPLLGFPHSNDDIGLLPGQQLVPATVFL